MVNMLHSMDDTFIDQDKACFSRRIVYRIICAPPQISGSADGQKLPVPARDDILIVNLTQI
ncbi:hypothetical protein ACO0LO_21130 [Undibacterium sp. TJN25]|uniref:hypothetical protein n=1 Tax=Undibacterium sp. TJN25 TaxID=3413056 RepID=UPI003BF30078